MGDVTMAGPAPPGGPLEIVFSFDTTGSMSSYIQQVRQQVTEIVTRLFADIPQLRIAIFAHGDYCDTSTYVTKYVDFTTDVSKLSDFVRKVGTTGGGDWEECYELVLQQVRTELSWTPGTQRVLVMIGDSIPHDTKYKLNKGKIDWKKETTMLRDMGLRIYAVQCGANNQATFFYEHLSNTTSGKHLNLDEFSTVVDMMMAVCYRETGPDFLEAYEREVRAREGLGIRKALGDMFDTLRDADTTTTIPANSSSVSGMSKSRRKPVGKRKRPVIDEESETDAVKSGTSDDSDSDESVKPTRPKKRKVGTKATQRSARCDVQSFLSKYRAHAVNRERVQPNEFILKDLPWTRWQMSIVTAANVPLNGIWKPRCGESVGMRNVALYADDIDKASVYEFAVQPCGSAAKVPLAMRITQGFEDMHWDTYLFRHGKINEQINRVLTRGCKLYSRRSSFDSSKPYDVNVNGEKVNISTVGELRRLMNRVYDYAWKDRFVSGKSRGFRRVTRSDVIVSE